jgi:phosphonate transport system ATP-binding protein
LTNLLKIEGLTKKYNEETIALRNIHLDFSNNEFVVVIGPSGSGKSTFIRCVNQLVNPTEGSIVFDNTEMVGMSIKDLRSTRTKIGMVFQDYNLIQRSSVLKNVLNGKLGQLNLWDTIFGRYSQEDVQQAIELLTELGLEDHVYKRADELSGGQQQRVGIARALMQKPKLLLADEPIASLDPASSTVVMDELKNVTEEKNITCIVNLHQVDIALQYATRIIGINKGQVVFDDSADKLTPDMIRKIYGSKLAEAKGNVEGDMDEN